MTLIFLCGAIAGAIVMGKAFHHWPCVSKPAPSWREGDRVRVENGRIVPR